MKLKSILRLLFIASLILPAACGVKDPVYNTPHPGHGTVTLTTDWSAIGEGLTAPDAYTVTATRNSSATAAYTAMLTGVTNRLDHLFEPGTYRFLVHNNPERVSMNGTIASVITEAVPPADAITGDAVKATVANSMPKPADNTERFVYSDPEWLFTSASDAALTADTEHALTAQMQQQVRQLTLIIEPTGGTADKIESITGTLSGVAGTLDTDSGTHGSPSCAALTFTKITTGTDAGKWSATVRLLGIAGEQQWLTGSIAFAGGIPEPFTLNSDLTTQLAAFNADKRSPVTIKLDVKVPDTPDYGKVLFTTDWSEIGTGLAVPENYTVTAVPVADPYTPVYAATLTGVNNRLDHLFALDTYRFRVSNTPEHITVSGTTASVATVPNEMSAASVDIVPNGMRTVGTFIHNAPGWLFYSEEELAITQDAEYALTAVMKQQVRQFTVIFEPVGIPVDQIMHVRGFLTGVASALDLSTGIHAIPNNVELPFTKITTGAYAGRWSATARLLGVTGEQQMLRIYVIIHNSRDFMMDSDLTRELVTFNTDKHMPFTIEISPSDN